MIYLTLLVLYQDNILKYNSVLYKSTDYSVILSIILWSTINMIDHVKICKHPLRRRLQGCRMRARKTTIIR